MFATPGDSSAFAPAEDNLLGGGGGSLETAQFDSSFPDLATQDQVRCLASFPRRERLPLLTLHPARPSLARPQTATTTITSGPSIHFKSGYQATVEDEEEPEVIKAWRERRDEQNAKRAEQFAQQREETIAEAQRNIDDFYENYNNKRDKLVSQTAKEAEQFLNSRDDVTSGGTSWERIAKIVDVSGKGAKGGAAGSGKERFRELLMSLRKDEKAPGAEGY